MQCNCNVDLKKKCGEYGILCGDIQNKNVEKKQNQNEYNLQILVLPLN